MKIARISLLLLAMFMAGVLAGRLLDSTYGKLLGTDEVVQIGIVVKDIEKASRAYAEILGTEVPPWFLTDTVDKAHTWFRGQPSEARAKLSFIKLRNITLELIEPVGGPSTWSEFLTEQGEGLHHIAFEIKGMEDKLRKLSERGIRLLQKGDYETGRYAYVDASGSLAVILELLENF